MDRISKNEYYMNIAVQVSLRSTCIRRKVGAIIVKDNRILGTGYNGAAKGIPNCCDYPDRCYRTANNIPSGTKLELCYAVHAEMNALFNAVQAGCDLKDSEIYVTTFPCSNCSKQIIQSGIKKIYYIDKYTNEFTLNMLEEAGVEAISMDGSIYNTPNIKGAERYTSQDLDCIDPIISEIYGKYNPGDEGFLKNREEVFRKYGLYQKYKKEKVLTIVGLNDKFSKFDIPRGYTELFDDKIGLYIKDYDHARVPVCTFSIDEFMSNVVKTEMLYRSEVEYSGYDKGLDNFIPKQIVVAALLYSNGKYYILKSKQGRLKGKFTMIQGHVSEFELTPGNPYYYTALNREIYRELGEEIKFELCENFTIPPILFEVCGTMSLNDNRVSQEHFGIIYKIEVDSSISVKSIESNEPDKHDVIAMTLEELKDPKNFNNMDTWLQEVVKKL